MRFRVICMTLDELEGTKASRDFIYISVTKQVKQFIYRQPFGIHFRYRHQVDGHNNRRHAPISLERIQTTKLWPNHNFAWYFAVSEVNTDIASGHFKNDGVVPPSLNFWRYLAIYFLENTIGVELGDNGIPKKYSKIPVCPCQQIIVKHYGGMWDPSKKKEIVKQKYQNQHSQNY